MSLASQFKESPSAGLLQRAKKSDLVEIAKDYSVSAAKPSLRKQEILNILAEYFIEEDILDEDAEDLIKKPSDWAQFMFEMRKLELEAQAEEKRLQREAEEKRL